MVLPAAPFMPCRGEFPGTYQYSLEPVLALPIARNGAPLAKAFITDVVPSPMPIATLPEITACWVSPLPWV
jgi:hypothetical protein